MLRFLVSQAAAMLETPPASSDDSDGVHPSAESDDDDKDVKPVNYWGTTIVVARRVGFSGPGRSVRDSDDIDEFEQMPVHSTVGVIPAEPPELPVRPSTNRPALGGFAQTCVDALAA